MDPTPDTPLSAAPTEWWLSVRCGCKTVQLHANHRARYLGTMTATELVARLRCSKCGGRAVAASWETWPTGLSRDFAQIRRVQVR